MSLVIGGNGYNIGLEALNQNQLAQQLQLHYAQLAQQANETDQKGLMQASANKADIDKTRLALQAGMMQHAAQMSQQQAFHSDDVQHQQDVLGQQADLRGDALDARHEDVQNQIAGRDALQHFKTQEWANQKELGRTQKQDQMDLATQTNNDRWAHDDKIEQMRSFQHAKQSFLNAGLPDWEAHQKALAVIADPFGPAPEAPFVDTSPSVRADWRDNALQGAVDEGKMTPEALADETHAMAPANPFDDTEPATGQSSDGIAPPEPTGDTLQDIAANKKYVAAQRLQNATSTKNRLDQQLADHETDREQKHQTKVAEDAAKKTMIGALIRRTTSDIQKPPPGATPNDVIDAARARALGSLDEVDPNNPVILNDLSKLKQEADEHVKAVPPGVNYVPQTPRAMWLAAHKQHAHAAEVVNALEELRATLPTQPPAQRQQQQTAIPPGLQISMPKPAATTTPSAGAAPAQTEPKHITTQEQYDALPKGTEYIDAMGNKATKRR